MLKFYDVDYDYIKYLKAIDPKVPNIMYEGNDKFVCGIVLSIRGINYYAPISHFNKAQRTNFPIYDKGKIISTIRFCFMFPAILSVLSKKDFQTINAENPKYVDLLKTEYTYCKAHEEEIRKKAFAVYKIGCNPKHPYFKDCCDFKALESAYTSYPMTKNKAE